MTGASRPEMSPTPTIRAATPQDATAIQALYAPHVTERTTSFELTPPSAQEMARRIAATLPLRPWLVCVEPDAEGGSTLLGYSYASAHRGRAAYRWSAESAIYVADTAQRRGVASALYRALFAILAHQGYFNVYAGVVSPNAPSAALHEAMGFIKVGVYQKIGYKRGAWRDITWYKKALAPKIDGATPTDPRPFSEVMTTDAVHHHMAQAALTIGPSHSS